MTRAKEDDANYRKALSFFFYDPFRFMQLLVDQCLGTNDALIPLVARILAFPLKDYSNCSLKHGQTIFFAFCMLKMRNLDQNRFEKLMKLISQFLKHSKDCLDTFPGRSAPELLFKTCLLYENFTCKRNAERSLLVLQTCFKFRDSDPKLNTPWCETIDDCLAALYFWKQMQTFSNCKQSLAKLGETFFQTFQSDFPDLSPINWKSLHVDVCGSLKELVNLCV